MKTGKTGIEIRPCLSIKALLADDPRLMFEILLMLHHPVMIDCWLILGVVPHWLPR